MGRERSGTGQHLSFCAAGLILVLLAACSSLGTIQAAWEGRARLEQGQQLISRGDFQGALRESEQVLARFPHTSPGDAALFTMGLIQVHHANPDRNYEQARALFARLEQEFPDSPRAEEARIWIGVLDALTALAAQERRTRRLQEQQDLLALAQERVQQLISKGDFAGALRESEQVLALVPQGPPGEAALFNMGLIHLHYANPRKDIGKALDVFGRLAREFPDGQRREEARIWAGVLETMEKAMRIDLEIEEKKKAMRR